MCLKILIPYSRFSRIDQTDLEHFSTRLFHFHKLLCFPSLAFDTLKMIPGGWAGCFFETGKGTYRATATAKRRAFRHFQQFGRILTINTIPKNQNRHAFGDDASLDFFYGWAWPFLQFVTWKSFQRFQNT